MVLIGIYERKLFLQVHFGNNVFYFLNKCKSNKFEKFILGTYIKGRVVYGFSPMIIFLELDHINASKKPRYNLYFVFF